MRIIEQYINTSIIKNFIGTVIIFTFLFVLVDITSHLDEFIDRSVPIPIIIKFYLAYFPMILVQTSPVACLMSILFTFSSLNTHNEIIALRASGLSFWKITKPAILFGLLISALIFWTNEQFVPQGAEIKRQITENYLILKVDRLRKKREKIKNLTFYGLENRLYFIDTFDPIKNKLSGITIIQYDNDTNILNKVVALQGKWTGPLWRFFNVQITSYGPDGNMLDSHMKVLPDKLMEIKETPEDFIRQRLNVELMNIRDLSEYINRFLNSGAKKALNNLRVDLHQKIAFPFGNLVVILLALPFSLMVKSRKGTSFISIGIAIGVFFLYYVINALMLAFGKGGLFPPVVAAWAAPVIFTISAWVVIRVNFE